MTANSPIKASIEKRLAEERYVEPRQKKKRRRFFNLQVLMIISIIMGLAFSVWRLYSYWQGTGNH